MSYKELEVGYQGLKAASFYIGDESEGVGVALANDGLGGDTLPTTYEYVYTSASSPTRTFHPNCPICLQKVRNHNIVFLFPFFCWFVCLFGLER